MRRILGLALLLAGLLVISIGTSLASASSKFAYTEQITAGGSLAVAFEEGSLKRFALVSYELNGTAIASWDCDGSIEQLLLNDAGTLVPNDGRTTGTLTLEMPPSGHVCAPSHIEYSSTTLTNVTTGHVYRIDPISQ